MTHQFCNNIEDAIHLGDNFYWDIPYSNEGKSGGLRCPDCRIWQSFPRKRKYKQPSYLCICPSCEKEKELIKEVSDMDKFTASLNELCQRITNMENKMVELLGKIPEDLIEIQGKKND